MMVDTKALVGLAEIAILAQVTKPAVANWRVRYPDFPRPVIELHCGPIYNSYEVKIWLMRHGKIGIVDVAR